MKIFEDNSILIIILMFIVLLILVLTELKNNVWRFLKNLLPIKKGKEFFDCFD